MRISGVQWFNAGGATWADKTASASFVVDRRTANRLLGRVVHVDAGYDHTDMVVNAINDFGIGSGLTQCSALSVVQHGYDLPYKDESSKAGNQIAGSYTEAGGAFVGSRYDSISTSTGSTTPMKVTAAIQRLLAASSDEYADHYSRTIGVEFRGRTIEKTLPLVQWSGDTVGQMLERLLAGEIGILARVEGNTLVIYRVDWDNVKWRLLSQHIIGEPDLSLSLDNSTTRVILEGKYITGYNAEDTFTAGSKVFGLPRLANGDLIDFSAEAKAGTTKSADFNAQIDTDYGVIRYTGTSSADCYVKFAQDRRTVSDTGYTGDAFARFGWRKRQGIVDDTLGVATGSLNATFDSRADMHTLAHRTVNELSRLLYTGSVKVRNSLPVSVGDVVTAWFNRYPMVVASVSYSSDEPYKVLSFGTRYQDVYGTLRERVQVQMVTRDGQRVATNTQTQREPSSGRVHKPKPKSETRSSTYYQRHYETLKGRYLDESGNVTGSSPGVVSQRVETLQNAAANAEQEKQRNARRSGEEYKPGKTDVVSVNGTAYPLDNTGKPGSKQASEQTSEGSKPNVKGGAQSKSVDDQGRTASRPPKEPKKPKKGKKR